MLTAIEVKPDVYWVGGLDWNARSFHGYTTEDGITYNAYLIMDEKVTLIDTTKAVYADELLQRISNIVDPAKIDVIIANHIEMDHSGAIPAVLEVAKDAQVYASEPAGVRELAAHFGIEGDRVHGVKTGDTLSIGKRELTFVQTAMVHWPDNMVTYSPYDKTLFSNDAFGQHFASGPRFDDEVDYHEVMLQAKKYYANIVQPYGPQTDKAVAAVREIGLENIELIAPSHGVCWRTHIADVIAQYEHWCKGEVVERAIIAYDSMWGSTDKIAHAIADGFMARSIPTKLMDLKVNHASDIMMDMLDAKYVCVGSPTLNSQMLPTVAAFLTYMRGLSPKNAHRVGLAFGSYGWAPLGPKNVAKVLEETGFNMPVETVAMNWIPSQEDLDAIRDKVADLIEAGLALNE